MKIIINKNRMALTLVEALIWFAVFAAVIAGVFALYSAARTSNMITTVNKEIATMYSKSQQFYEGTGSLGAGELSGANINQVAINLGIIPKTLKVSGSSIKSIFGGNVILYDSIGGLIMQYTEVPTGKICSGIVSGQKKIGWRFVVVGGLSRVYYDDTYKISDVQQLCKGDNGVEGSTILLQFATCTSC